jgi:hypothetical protein
MTESNKKNNPYEKLFDLIVTKKIMPSEKAEAWCYAMHDIEESILKIKNKILPHLLSPECDDPEKFQQEIWSIREEFRHVQYHINDGKLTD